MANKLAQHFSGPILFTYVWWVLKEALDRNINTLYFLARDGYLLREIALRFCITFNLNIECKYLYCSRASLRMPTYHLIGDEAFDLLLLGGYHVTLRSILQRANLNDIQRADVYCECGLQNEDENRALSKAELNVLRQKLRQSQTYRKYVNEKSQTAYPDTVGYLRQEGVFDHKTIALVDSGWTGSMQRSLRQLLESQGFRGNLVGFYFGMYAQPRSTNDGAYLTWYFNSRSRPSVKIPFCNNLFECLLSAPHGMTIGYSENSGKYSPVLLPCGNAEKQRAQEQISAVLEYAGERLSKIDFNCFDTAELLQRTRKLTQRYMARPRKNEVAYYGQFMFCDDTTEAYSLPLAAEGQTKALKTYLLPYRLRKRFSAQKSASAAELFWPYGTIALLPKWKQFWYRWNIYIWEWLRYVLA